MKTGVFFSLFVLVLISHQVGWGMDIDCPELTSEIAVIQNQVDAEFIEAVKEGGPVVAFFKIEDRSEKKRGYQYTMPNLNRQDHEGKTCLHYAVLGGNKNQCVQYLLSRGANPLLHDDEKKMPYEYGNSDTKMLLLPAMARQACAQGDIETLKILLERKIILPQAQWAFDALQNTNFIDMVTVLIKYGINAKTLQQEITQDTLLHAVVQRKNTATILRHCLLLNIDIFARNKSGLTALDYALLAGDAQSVETLLPSYTGGENVGKVLLSALSADTNEHFLHHVNTVLETISFTCQELEQAYEKLCGLLATKLRIQENHNTYAQRYAIAHTKALSPALTASINQLQACKKLLTVKLGTTEEELDNKLIPLKGNSTTATGTLSLDQAVKDMDVDEVTVLLKQKIEQGELDQALFTAAQMHQEAITRNPAMDAWTIRLAQKLEIFDLLIHNGANINAKKEGNTLLHVATQDGIWGAVQELINTYGADLYAQNSAGNTAMHIAVENMDVAMVKTLVALEAAVRNRMDEQTKLQHPQKLSDVANGNNQTAQEMAVILHDDTILESLQRANTQDRTSGSALLPTVHEDECED